MDSDDLYPNSGEFFTTREPLQQQNERREEKAVAGAGKQIIKKMLKHFNEQLAILDSTSSIPEEVLTDPAKFMHTVHGYQIAYEYLDGQKRYLEGLLDE